MVGIFHRHFSFSSLWSHACPQGALVVQESPFRLDCPATSSCLSLWGRTPFELVREGLARRTVPRAGRRTQTGSKRPQGRDEPPRRKRFQSWWPLALKAKSPVSLAAPQWGGWVASLWALAGRAVCRPSPRVCPSFRKAAMGGGIHGMLKGSVRRGLLKIFYLKGGKQRGKVCIL